MELEHQVIVKDDVNSTPTRCKLSAKLRNVLRELRVGVAQRGRCEELSAAVKLVDGAWIGRFGVG